MKNLTANVNTKVSGLNDIKELFGFRKHLSHDVNSTINVHANGTSVNDVQKSADHLQHTIDHFHGNNNFKNSFAGDASALNNAGNAGSRLGDRLYHASHRADSLGSHVKRVGGALKSAFAGGMVANFASSAYNASKTVVKAGWALNMAGAKAKATWSHIGISNTQSNDMVSQMDKIRDSSDMDENSINQLQKRFYTLTGSAGQARSLTNEITSFGKASGATNQQVDQLGTTLPRLLSAGKVRAQMFNRTFSHAPAMVGALAKASGHSRSAFLKLVDSGKMTGQQLKQYLSGAAKYSGQAWNEYTKTAGGRIAYIKGLARESEQSATKGLTSSFVKGLNQIGSNNKNLDNVRKSLAGISNTLGKKVGNFAGKAIAYIIKNQKPLFRIGSELFRIVGIMVKGVWKQFTWILGLFSSRSHKTGSGLKLVANMLTAVARHKTALKAVADLMLVIYARKKYIDFKRYLGLDQKGVGGLTRSFKTLLLKIKSTTLAQKTFRAISLGFTSVVGVFKTFFTTLRAGVGVQAALNVAMDANPVGAIIVGVTALVAALTGLFFWLRHLYRTNKSVRRAFNEIGRAGKLAFKIITLPVRALFKLLGAVVKRIWRATSGIRKHIGGAAHKVGSFFSRGYKKASGAVGHFARKVAGSNAKASRSSRHSAANAARSTRGYLSKSGRYYKHYHKGLTRMSRASYKERERMQRHYSTRAHASLIKSERAYRRYQNKRSSLGRKYGKLRAMYSVKSLKLIETRFRRLRRDILKETKSMYNGTRRYFHRIGRGSGNQFRGIYRAARRWLNKTRRLQVRDFKTMSRNSRRLLEGSVRRYIKLLRKRFTSQRYYDRQLIKQTRRTNTIMKKLPLAWITRETKGLIANWRRQRRSFVVHNQRMTKSLVTHIHTMSHHFRNFQDSTETIFDDMERNVEKGFTKFFDNLHDIAGKGMNSVQSPLNTGAQHLNGFVSAFGETTPPLHSMPTISYATGTGALGALAGVSGLRRPITQLTHAVLNDDANNGQETVVHSNGATEKPQGANVQTVLQPGDEVLNASETRLMDAIARPVHLASGTGFFSKLKGALTGTGNVSQSTLYGNSKGKGKERLLNELQDEVLKSPAKIVSGMFGSKPNGGKGVIGDIITGAYGLGGQQASEWFNTLTGLIDKTLNAGGSSSKVTDYAEKNFSHIPYSMGGESKSAMDCSAMVQTVLKHFGVDVPRTTAEMESSSQLQYTGKTGGGKPGQVVLWGSGNGAAGHVGLISRPGYAFQETPPYSRETPLSYVTALPLHGFYNIRGLKNTGNDNGLHLKTNSALGKFVSQQEKPMLSWINKNLVPLMDPNPAGPGVKKWIPIIKRAAEMTHSDLTPHLMSLLLGTMQNESGGNATINGINDRDGTGAAKGLLQYKQSTFDAYAYPGHHNILSGLDQLLAFFNSTNYKTALVGYDSANGKGGGEWSPAHGSGPSGGRRFARGGKFKAGQLMTVGEHGQELIKPNFSGEVIPHERSKQIINNSKKPVDVKQNITINVKDGSKQSAQHIISVMQQYGDKLADKFSGGDIVY